MKSLAFWEWNNNALETLPLFLLSRTYIYEYQYKKPKYKLLYKMALLFVMTTMKNSSTLAKVKALTQRIRRLISI